MIKLFKNHNIKICFAGILLLAGSLKVQSQPMIWPAIDTNIISSKFTGFSQGWGYDGTNSYNFRTSDIYKHSPKLWQPAIANLRPFSGLGRYNHIGAGTYYGGKLYAPMEDWHGCGNVTNQSIGVFDSEKLQRLAVLVVSNYQNEISAVTVAPDLNTDGLLIAASFCDGKHIFEYTLPNLHYFKTLTLSQNIPSIQGIGYYRGFIFVDGDSGAFGLIYAINSATGKVYHLASLTVPGATEYEGLDVSQGELRIAESGTQSCYIYHFVK